MAGPLDRKRGLPSACDGTTESCSSPPPPPPPPVPHSNSRLVTVSVIAASVLVFLGLVSLFVYCFIRRRRRQRRQQSLLAAEAANPGVEGGGHVMAAPAPGVEGGGPEQGGGEEAVHHAWHIRTVGLDEAAIESIALTRYRAGAGMLGAADCSVCLGEFRDGELLRLLPKCGHAFHVPCIDTWLRAHVNCPLCRADVLDPEAAAGDSDPPAGANAGTVAEQASSNIDETLDHEQAGPGQQQNEQQELRVQIDQRDHPSSPEPLHRHPGSQVQKFRRVASMDLSLAPATESPEDELNSKEKRGNGGDTACFKVSSGSGRSHLMKRSLSGGGRWSLASRHCRTRSSVLPL